jgi:hypothetical protein
LAKESVDIAAREENEEDELGEDGCVGSATGLFPGSITRFILRPLLLPGDPTTELLPLVDAEFVSGFTPETAVTLAEPVG